MLFFISSPIESLKEFRCKIQEGLKEFGFLDNEIFISEYSGSNFQSSYNKCFSKIEECSLFILILGSEYGSTPTNYEKSITELEYDKAIENKKIDRVIVYKLNVNTENQEQEIEKPDELQERVKKDLRCLFANILEYKEKPTKEIGFGKKTDPIIFKAKEFKNFLSFRARIQFSHAAGCHCLLQIKVNNEYIKASDLINKDKYFEYKNMHRKINWFNENTNSWRLLFSKDFTEIYSNQKYQILNGDPYYFVFNLKNIRQIDNQYHVTLTHNGDKNDEHYNNPIIIENLELIGY